jgi:hypothetical protein
MSEVRLTFSGGIGQPLSLLLKLNKKISELALYDIRGTPGVAADIAHIDTHSKVPPHSNAQANNRSLATFLRPMEMVFGKLLLAPISFLFPLVSPVNQA